MPTIRYQIRNEYGLADPELHRAADKDDPEAILEGVAMAGLAGVLRQLGDLAEFAAEIFRDLHEEVMGTAARGHGLILRVQQLEADFPSFEKAIFSQTNHSGHSYNDGIDWHSNFHLDQNLVTQGDMPRFVMDSYEECREPPRLFTLDKFDTAGAGACLKRYSDPSFFKTELTSSGFMEADKLRERKSRRIKKKGSRIKNGHTLESLLSPRANSDSQPAISDQVADKSATRFVRLKLRNLDDTNGSKGCGSRKHLLQLHLDIQKIAFDSSQSSSTLSPGLIDSSVPTSLTHDTARNMSENDSLVRDSSPTMNGYEELTRATTYELGDWNTETKKFSESADEPIVGVPNTGRGYNLVESMENSADSEINSEGSAYDNELNDIVRNTSQRVEDHKLVRAELQLEGSTDGYRTEDIGSEPENFMDAPNSMESEVETDSENKGRPDIGSLKTEGQEMDTDASERLEELDSQTSELNNTGPERSNNMSNSGMTSNINSLDEVLTNQEAEKTQEPSLLHGEVANSADLVSNGGSNMETFEDPMLKPEEIINEHLDSYDPASDLLNVNPGEISARCLIPRNNNTSARNDIQLDNGPPCSNLCLLEKTHPEDHVNEDIHMVDHFSCPLIRNTLAEDLESEVPFSMIVASTEEMQVPVDQEIKNCISKEDADAASSSVGISISMVASEFAPDISMDDLKHGELITDVNNCQHPEELPSETSFCAKGTDGVAQYHTTGNSNLGCDSVLLLSEEMASNLDSSVDKTKQASILPKDFVPYDEVTDDKAKQANIVPKDFVLYDEVSDDKTKQASIVPKHFVSYDEVPLQASTTNIGKSPGTMNQYAETCPSESLPVPAHVISAISDADYATEMESVVAVKNLEASSENGDDGAKRIFSMPIILQPQFEYFSGSEESLESPKMNFAEESQESFKVNHEEKAPLCSAGEAFSEDVSNSTMLDDNLEFSNEFYRGSSQNVVEVPEQNTDHESLTEETFASKDKDNNKKLNLAHNEEALDQHLHLEESEDLATLYGHQPIIYEFDSLNTVELESQRTLNMEDSPALEQSSLDPAASCFDLPVNNSSNANDSGLRGDIHETMPAGHVKAYPVLKETYLNYPTQREHTDSICLAQGELESIQGDMSLPTYLIFDFASSAEEASMIPTSNEDISTLHTSNGDVTLQASNGNASTLQSGNEEVSPGQAIKEIVSASQASNEEISSSQISNQELYYLQDRNEELYEASNHDVSTLQASSEEVSASQANKEVVSTSQVSNEEVLPLQVCNEEFSTLQAIHEDYSTLEARNQEALTLQTSNESGFLHQKGECVELEIPIDYNGLEDKPIEGPEPNYHALTNNVLLKMPTSNIDETSKMDSQALVSSECNSEISPCHEAYNISDMPFYPLSGSDVTDFESATRILNEPQSCNSYSCFPSQNYEPPPPLPPLPPLEWRSRKLSSLLPNQNSIQALPGENLFMSSSGITPTNSHITSPISLSQLPPIVADYSNQPDFLSSTRCIADSSLLSSSISSSLEYEKNQHASDVDEAIKLPLEDSFFISESQLFQNSMLQKDIIQPLMEKRSEIGEFLPVFGSEKSQYSEDRHLHLENMVQSQNPFLFNASIMDESHSILSLSSGLGMPQHGYVYSLERSQPTLFAVVPTNEGETIGINPRSIRNRPRNPLIDAVVAHDRSKLRKVPEVASPSDEPKSDQMDTLLESNILQLRKVSELARPSDKPKAEEKDALLEQIRNKSYNLKPATVLSKPNNKSHSTNIRVAAILEKANAVRQAMAGSDEEDGEDNWSDC
ncbi:protein SCAR2-like [Zingiber officinale]|uniref:protein SCAR2-like n=1 Tax=Zingiber officinale TaxID=94328 RepID=UPI001C4D46F7|nr:protein SCAR2-like [Zingiber officinale]